METFLIRALQLILSLSLLVIIHEGGHFFFAQTERYPRRGCRASEDTQVR